PEPKHFPGRSRTRLRNGPHPSSHECSHAVTNDSATDSLRPMPEIRQLSPARREILPELRRQHGPDNNSMSPLWETGCCWGKVLSRVGTTNMIKKHDVIFV